MPLRDGHAETAMAEIAARRESAKPTSNVSILLAQSEQALTLDLQTSLQTTFFSCAMIRGYLDKDDTFVFPSKIHFFPTIEFIPTFSQRR